ncbi:AI-2E family transporter [Methylonatrum kenyense]|uniref:AI-2E family transporter n=1 Tax=Methylonatrum kenyense TaxID=455253 RepID=UPI0020BFA5D2|nr:AI-2E family transporter [Methylonatrum kenyense]MCK8517252.1 AI-2E family transporter [Methylonatrum kenyense]
MEPTRGAARKWFPPGDPLRISVHGLFALGVLYTLYLAHQVVLPITLAILVSLLLSPAVTALARRGIHRVVAALITLTLFVTLLAGTAWMTAQPMLDWAEQAPDGLARLMVQDGGLREALDSMTDSARQVEEAMEELREEGADEQEPTPVVLESESWRGQLMVNAQETGVAVVLALALSYFLLVSGNSLIINFTQQLRSRERRRTALRMVRDCQREIGRYLVVITLSNGSVGILTGLMAWAVGLPSPAVWGLLAALLRFVPYLGVVATVALLLIVSAASLESLVWVLAVPAGYLLLNTIVGFFIEPWIHGYRLSVNPVVIFLAIFFWGWLWGPVGVLLAVPLMTVIQVILRHVESLRPVHDVIARR